MILIYGKAGRKYIVHDPGLPAMASRQIQDLLFKAWAYSGADKTALMAFKKQ